MLCKPLPRCTSVEVNKASGLKRSSNLWANAQLGAAAVPPSVIQTLHSMLGERPQHCVLMYPLAVLRVELVPVNIFYHSVRDQVFHTQIPPESPADLCGARLIPHPFPHQEYVVSVARQRVRRVHGPLGLQPASTDADEAETSNHLLHVVVLPQAGDPESLQEISSTQELHLRTGAWGGGGG